MAELNATLPAALGGEGASRVVGFEVAIFQGTNPDLAGNRVRTIECGTNIRDAVIPVSAGDTALTVRAAGRAIYSSGVRSAWSILGPDVIDAFTTPFPTKTEITESLDLNGHEVFYGDTAPASGMVEGDYWFDTTEIVEGGMTRTRYQPYRFDGAAWVAETKAVMVASALAAGIVGAREIKTVSITADKIATGQLKTSNYAEDGSGNPTAGAKLDHTGTAMKVAPQNFQIGNFNLYQMVRQYEVWFYNLESTEAPSFSVAGQPDQPDTNYAVIVTPIGSTGTPNINSFVVRSVSKTTTAVSITIFEAPGNGNSVRFNVAILRAP